MFAKIIEEDIFYLKNLDSEARQSSEAKRQSIHYRNDCSRYKAENQDLAIQVCSGSTITRRL